MARVERPRMRPRFEVANPPLQGAVVEALKDHLREHDGCVGQFFNSEVRLGIKQERTTVWSPYLHVRFDENEAGDVVLRGQFMPHPNVWTTFMAIYGVLSMLGVLGTMYGLAQVALGRPPWALLSIPLAAAVIAFVYGASLIGQGLGAEQMYELRTLLDDSVQDAVDKREAV